MQVRKILTIPVLLVGLLIVFQLSRSIISMYGRGGRGKELAAEVAGLEERKRELEEEKKFRETQEFVEREARDKLRMVREGERILVLPGGQDEEISNIIDPKDRRLRTYQISNDEEKANWQRWIDYWLR